MNEELIYRRDCDLFAESLDYEEIINNLMRAYGLTWDTNPEGKFSEFLTYEFARKLLQRAQNVIDTADTIAYERDFIARNGDKYTYLTYKKEKDENDYTSGRKE